ncbi:MAG: GDP-mannose 4,6-dehydratase [Pseudomonadota bacterium]
MKVLVTGVAGFVGSWVGQRLLNKGHKVVGMDNFDPFYDRKIKEQNLAPLVHSNFEFFEGDILNPELLNQILPGVNRVVHLAALAGIRPSKEQPQRYMRVNAEGTIAILEACLRHEVHHLVVASSSSVYGARSKTPFSEDDPCDHPASPYAASKKATELVCSTFHQLYGMGISCLRYFTVFGPRQRPEMAIHKFVRLCMMGEPIPMFGDGFSGRDYTYVDDIVDGTIAALERVDNDFQIYNLGGANPVLLKDLIKEIGMATGKTVRIDRQPWQSGDVPITCADVKKAEQELDYRPSIPLQEGLERFVKWYNTKSP